MSDLLVVSEGRLSLDRHRCWLDTSMLDALVARVESAARDPGSVSLRDCEAMARELLQLYAGHFLDRESQEPWAVAARDRLRAKFVRAVTALGGILEQRKAWEQATALYLRALELDNLAEGLYRRLMIVYREQGEPAEAINIYRRCRDMLSIVLNMKPSPETEAIRGTLT